VSWRARPVVRASARLERARGVALVIGLTCDALRRFCGPRDIAKREEPFASFREQSRAVHVRQFTSSCGGQELELGPLWVVLCRELKRLECKLVSHVSRVQREGPLRTLGERPSRRLSQGGCLDPRRLGEGQRFPVMVGEHLGVILGAVAGEGREPLRRAPMLPRPLRAGDLAVRDVSHERVQERVLRFPADRGAAVTADELLPPERVEDLLIRARQCTGPEDFADHGCVL